MKKNIFIIDNKIIIIMQKILLLSFIYLVSSKLQCTSQENWPAKNEDCFNRAVENEDDSYCCFGIFGLLRKKYNRCFETPKSDNPEFRMKLLNSKYNEYNVTIYNLSCPAIKNESNSNNSCNTGFNIKGPEDCFYRNTKNKESNYCCFLNVSVGNASQTGCKEIPKNETLSNIKKQLIKQGSEFHLKVDNLECPPIENEEKEKEKEKEKKENSPQENTSNKGFYIKSGLILPIAFLF